MNSKGKWRGTKKRTNTWKITEQRNELLKARPTERSPERTANWPTERPTNRPPDRLTKRQTESATDRLTDLLSNRLTDRPTDRPTEETNNRGNYVLKEQTNKIPTDRTKKRDKKRVTDPMHGQKDTEKNEQMNESEQNKKMKKKNKQIKVLELCIVDTNNTKQQTKQQNLKAYSRAPTPILSLYPPEDWVWKVLFVVLCANIFESSSQGLFLNRESILKTCPSVLKM